MSRRIAAHVVLDDLAARPAASLEAVVRRAQDVLAREGIVLEVDLAYDLDTAAGRAQAEHPSLTKLRAERDGAATWRDEETG